MQTIVRIEEAFRDGDSGSMTSSSYISIIQRINALRMICDLGLTYASRHDPVAAEEVHEMQCADVCDITTSPLMNSSTESSPSSYFGKCLSYICSDCAQQFPSQGQAVACGHRPAHSIATVSTSWVVSEDSGA